MEAKDLPGHAFSGEQSWSEANIFVSLTQEPLDANMALSRVKSPKAGAVVLFAGKVKAAPYQAFQTDSRVIG